MATLYGDYQQLIMRAYERKKGSNTLPHGLMHLTPANLKEECIKKCTIGVSKRDEKVIRDFCGDLNESKKCQVILQLCHTDKFRPLVNYLKGKSENPEVKNIELLAWLIDFPGRPWEIGKTIPGDDDMTRPLTLSDTGLTTGEHDTPPASQANPPTIREDSPVENPEIPEIPITPVCIDTSGDRENTGIPATTIAHREKIPKKSAKTMATAIMLSLAVGTGGMWLLGNNWPGGAGECMYWQEDHYEPVACNQKIPNKVIIPRDTLRLKYFRKITRPDTLTYQSMGKVWYSKIKTNLEFYTMPGEHPVVFGYQLKPISTHIIDEHILSKKQ